MDDPIIEYPSFLQVGVGKRGDVWSFGRRSAIWIPESDEHGDDSDEDRFQVAVFSA